MLTIDLEDWFHCLEPEPTRWSSYCRRAEVGTERLLSLLDEARAKATFFVLGDVARHAPDLVRRVAEAGHEVGSHGMLHRFVSQQTPLEFRQDVHDSVALLQDLSGEPVTAYRAPCFSIVEESLWALDILLEEGIRCDSSIHPVHNPRYGISDAPRLPSDLVPGLLEWPVSTFPTLLGKLPFAGGAYFRFLPRAIFRRLISRLERVGEPLLLYIHPWELDPEQPRARTSSWFLTLRHYHGLEKTEARLREILAHGAWTTIREGASRLRTAALA